MINPPIHRICLLESRPEDAIGACLAAESIVRHEPEMPIHIHGVRAGDASEVLRRHGNISLDPSLPEGIHSWNCKPHVMLPLLRRYGGRVTWLDSDIIVTDHFAPLFEHIDLATIVIACESSNAPTVAGAAVRARGWGFPVKRDLVPTPNTCIVSFTAEHIPLLERWRDVLNSTDYKALQALPLTERPIHAWSDQDVLSALLASEFGDTPVHILALGRDFIHVGHSLSYHGRERLANVHRLPPFIHSGAARPWSRHFFQVGGPVGYLRKINRDVSPYYLCALDYADSYPQIRQWKKTETLAGKLLRLIGLENPALAGLPLWTAAAAIRGASRWIKR